MIARKKNNFQEWACRKGEKHPKQILIPYSITSSAGTHKGKRVFKRRQGLSDRRDSSLDPGFSGLVFLQAAHHKAIFSLFPSSPAQVVK